MPCPVRARGCVSGLDIVARRREVNRTWTMTQHDLALLCLRISSPVRAIVYVGGCVCRVCTVGLSLGCRQKVNRNKMGDVREYGPEERRRVRANGRRRDLQSVPGEREGRDHGSTPMNVGPC